MTWKAKIDIGDYKAGEEVPEDKAILWNEMYDISPVEQIGATEPEPVVEPEPEPEPEKVKEEPPKKPKKKKGRW